jgi:DNA-binding response OmpR family regulator
MSDIGFKASRPGKILVVNSNVVMFKLMSDILEAHDYECLGARTGETGIELARANLPDVIFIQLSLPDMQGVDAVREIRTNEHLDRVKFALCQVS